MSDNQEHYSQIVAVLLAGGVQARPVSNDEYDGISVKDTEGKKRIVWTDYSGLWGWTMIDLGSGEATTGHTTLDGESSPEDVAIAIACYDYDRVEV